MYQSKNSLCRQLVAAAFTSEIEHQLAACVIKNGRMVTKPCINHHRNSCRGNNEMGSLHAEASAVLNWYGKDLSFDHKKGWCLLRQAKGETAET